MIKPRQLKQNSKIGIVSPSYWLNVDVLNKTAKYYSDMGFRIKIGPSNKLKNGPFAGSPEERAEDINAMFADPSIDAIFCARGGYGCNKVLPLLDYELIKDNPKIFMGFSDITACLNSITQKTKMVSFHGPMLVSNKNGIIEFNMRIMQQVLSGTSDMIIDTPKETPAHILKSGVGRGPLWGGNMTLLINRLGTEDNINTDGVILFLEDINEYLYSFERMLIHMKIAGMFDKIAGLVFGELKDLKEEDIPFGKSSDEIIMDICGELEIPIVSNYPCGHGKYQATLPISIPAELNANDHKPYLTILESAVNKDE
ncbi:MAG: LD-carboxypeptidase [bacterium TMED46]|nr:MAG: LD-carboxypeptidase [bacterium TMED46]